MRMYFVNKIRIGNTNINITVLIKIKIKRYLSVINDLHFIFSVFPWEESIYFIL